MEDSASHQFFEELSRVLVRNVSDPEARGMARDALQAIDSHSKICVLIAQQAAETRARIEKAQKDLNDKTDRLTAKIDSVLSRATWGIIMILGSALVFFLVPFFARNPL